jgi:hypothetical protein
MMVASPSLMVSPREYSAPVKPSVTTLPINAKGELAMKKILNQRFAFEKVDLPIRIIAKTTSLIN